MSLQARASKKLTRLPIEVEAGIDLTTWGAGILLGRGLMLNLLCFHVAIWW